MRDTVVGTDPADVEAAFDKGVLTVRAPEVEKAKSKKIQIKAEA